MERLPNIVKFTANALDGVKSLEKKIVDRTAICDLEKEIWMVYKNCESAIFLVKLEISDVEAVDNTKIQIDIDRPEYMMILAEDHLNIASKLINEGKMSDVLEQLRSARNIMAEIYSNVKQKKLHSLRKSRKRRDASDQKLQ